ncbi:hypothetical protein EMIT0P74_10037 [Pseudomonas sp. IT-P74]
MTLTERLRVLAGARFERFEHDYQTFVPGGRSWEASDSIEEAVLPVVNAQRRSTVVEPWLTW